MNRRLTVLAGLCCLLLAACGQMGPLTLPADTDNGDDQEERDDDGR